MSVNFVDRRPISALNPDMLTHITHFLDDREMLFFGRISRSTMGIVRSVGVGFLRAQVHLLSLFAYLERTWIRPIENVTSYEKQETLLAQSVYNRIFKLHNLNFDPSQIFNLKNKSQVKELYDLLNREIREDALQRRSHDTLKGYSISKKTGSISPSQFNAVSIATIIGVRSLESFPELNLSTRYDQILLLKQMGNDIFFEALLRHYEEIHAQLLAKPDSYFDRLESFDVRGFFSSDLLYYFNKAKNLKTLRLHKVTLVPESVAKISSLRTLILTENYALESRGIPKAVLSRRDIKIIADFPLYSVERSMPFENKKTWADVGKELRIRIGYVFHRSILFLGFLTLVALQLLFIVFTVGLLWGLLNSIQNMSLLTLLLLYMGILFIPKITGIFLGNIGQCIGNKEWPIINHYSNRLEVFKLYH